MRIWVFFFAECHDGWRIGLYCLKRSQLQSSLIVQGPTRKRLVLADSSGAVHHVGNDTNAADQKFSRGSCNLLLDPSQVDDDPAIMKIIRLQSPTKDALIPNEPEGVKHGH
jgi:hypothetical protein